MRVKTHNERIEELETEISELKSTISTLETSLSTVQTTITKSGLGQQTQRFTTDLDNVKYSGFGYASSTTAGGTSISNGYVITIVYTSSYIIQYYQAATSGALQVRRCVNGTWTSFTNV